MEFFYCLQQNDFIDCYMETERISSMKKIVFYWNMSLLVVIFGILIFVNIKSLNYFVNSDFAAQIVLADIVSKTHKILPGEWNFSTEIHISFATLFATILLWFCERWDICYIVSNILTYIVLMIVGGRLCKKLEMKAPWIFFTLTLFLAPVSYWKLYYYNLGNEYLTYFIYELIYLDLWLQTKRGCEKKDYILFGIWSCFLGSMGMRYALACFAPAVIVECIVFLYRHEQKNCARQEWFNLVCSHLGFLLGLIVNRYVLSIFYTVKRHNRYFVSLEELPDRMAIALQRMLELFGYKEGATLFSGQGIANMFSIVMILAIVFAISYFGNQTIYGNYIKFVVCTNILNVLVLILTCEDENYYNDIRGKYFILALFICIPIMSMCLSELLEKRIIFGGGYLRY